MSKTIWKYSLVGGEQNMFFADLPIGAQVLSADWEQGRFVVWAIIEKDVQVERRWFHIAGTDHEIPEGVLGARFLNRIDIPTIGQFGNTLTGRYHAFDGGWAPGSEG